MGLGVNTNLPALSIQRRVAGQQSVLGEATRRLSSGMRIASARDDAAGLAIAARMTAQLRGNEQAARNLNDGISLLQTAEGALAAATAQLQRMRDLTVQGANGMLSASDRQALQAEAEQLAAEVDRISVHTRFNGTAIFDQGGRLARTDTTQLAILDGLRGAGGWLESAESLVSSLYGLSADGAALSIELKSFTDGKGGVAARVVASTPGSGQGEDLKLQVDIADFTPPNLPNGGSAPLYNDRIIAHEMVHAVMARATNWGMLNSDNNLLWFVEGAAEFIHGADERVAADINANIGGQGGAAGQAAGRDAIAAALSDGFQGASLDYSAAYAATRYLHQRIKAQGGSGIRDLMTYLNANPNDSFDDALDFATRGAYGTNGDFLADFAANGAAFISSFNLGNVDTGAMAGQDVDGGAAKSAESTVTNTSSRAGDDVLAGFAETFERVAGAGNGVHLLMLQSGAEAGNGTLLSLGRLDLTTLGLDRLDLVNEPTAANVALDRALEAVLAQRTEVGAQLSRLESAVDTLQSASVQLSASRGRLEDADYAIEAGRLVRTKILQAAGNAVLAQANQLPRQVLRLLRL